MKLIVVALKLLALLFVIESAFAIHEYGHLREYQKRGVAVDEFSLGIGPKLYERIVDGVKVQLRLIPLVAYVSATEKGAEDFTRRATLTDSIAVYSAGVKNNLVSGVALLFFFQLLGWQNGNVSNRQLVRTLLLTPCKIAGQFGALLLATATFGKINVTGSLLLSTGGIRPPLLLGVFLVFSLGLGLANLVPIPPLDGSKIAYAILKSWNVTGFIDHVPKWWGTLLLITFIVKANSLKLRLLETPQAELLKACTLCAPFHLAQ